MKTPHPVRVVLSTPAVMSFVSVWKAGALAMAQLGVGAFFVAGVTRSALGPSAVWFVLAATIVSAFVRAIDVESWALLIPGGTIGRLQQAFGPRSGRVGAAAVLIERILLAAMAATLAGHYATGALVPAIRGEAVAAEELATVVAMGLIGLLWMRARIGLAWTRDAMARGIWVGTSVLAVVTVWALVSVQYSVPPLNALLVGPPVTSWTPWPAANLALAWLFGLALATPAIGGGEALSRAAHEFAPPRLQSLRRTRLVVLLFTVLFALVGTLLYVQLVPAGEQAIWLSTPWAGIASHLSAPPWMRSLLGLGIAVAAVATLAPAVHVALGDAESVLQRLTLEGTLSVGFSQLHRRFGTPVRVIDMTAAAAIAAIVATGSRMPWLGHAYAVAVVSTLVLTITAVLRLRRTRPGTPYRAPLNLRVNGRDIPFGTAAAGTLLSAAVLATMLMGDVPSMAAAAALTALVLVLQVAGRGVEPEAEDEALDAFDVRPASDVSLDHLQVRPGSVLVPVRNPHALDHVAAALRAAGDRDVVVMTVRLIDADDGTASPDAPTPYERRLLSDVVAVTERVGKPVRLLIVPARQVIDALGRGPSASSW